MYNWTGITLVGTYDSEIGDKVDIDGLLEGGTHGDVIRVLGT